MGTKYIDRFWSKVDKRGPDECWLWMAYLNPWGYGSYYTGAKMRRCHRIAYELAKGPIPDGLQIDHICRNRACCNPAHLEAVTNLENTLRGDNFIAHHAKATQCPQGHPYSAENTYIYPNGRRGCRICKKVQARMSARRVRTRMRGQV